MNGPSPRLMGFGRALLAGLERVRGWLEPLTKRVFGPVAPSAAVGSTGLRSGTRGLAGARPNPAGAAHRACRGHRRGGAAGLGRAGPDRRGDARRRQGDPVAAVAGDPVARWRRGIGDPGQGRPGRRGRPVAAAHRRDARDIGRARERRAELCAAGAAGPAAGASRGAARSSRRRRARTRKSAASSKRSAGSTSLASPSSRPSCRSAASS